MAVACRGTPLSFPTGTSEIRWTARPCSTKSSRDSALRCTVRVHAARACACWVLHTFLAEYFLVSPRLSISSPTKGCGKTTLLDVLYRLVLRPLLASNVTPAAVFRVIEKYKPCLLIDEADTFLGVNDELRGILNSGHRKGGSVLRVTGDDLEPRQFATFAPCGIALIGTLPPTLADRSIPVELNRRRPNEPVESFRPDRAGRLEQLARQAARWARDNAVALQRRTRKCRKRSPTAPATIGGC